MSAEINALSKAVNNPPKPYVVILGGAKCDDSLRIALNLLDKGVADTIVPVGVVGNLMLWAAGYRLGQGNESFIKQSLGDAFDSTFQDATRCIEQHRDQLLLPADLCRRNRRTSCCNFSRGITVIFSNLRHRYFDSSISSFGDS